MTDTSILAEAEADDSVVLDFPARIGGRPYIRHTGGEWRCLTLVYSAEAADSERRLTLARYPTFTLTRARVARLVETARRVETRAIGETPYATPDAYPVVSAEEFDPPGETKP